MASIVKFVVKSAVAGSLILVTLRVTHGPWQVPHVVRLKEGENVMDQPPINSTQESPDVFKETWNKGVMKIFHGLHEAPSTLKEISHKTITQLKEKYNNANK